MSSEDGEVVKRRPKFVDSQDLPKIYGNVQWHKTITEARYVVGREPAVTVEGEPINFKPIEGVEKAYYFLTQRYAEYVLLLKIMDRSMRQLLHPQKRILFKRFIEAVACRICELKNEMTKLSCTNVHNLMGCYSDLGVTPDQVEYKIPDCLLQDQRAALKEKERILSVILETIESHPDCDINDIIASTITQESQSGSSKTDEVRELSVRSKDLSPKNAWHRTRSLTSAVSLFSLSKKKRRSSGSSTSLNSTELEDPRSSANKSSTEHEDFISSRRYKEWLEDPAFHAKVRLLQHRWRVWQGRQAGHVVRKGVDAFIDMSIENEEEGQDNGEATFSQRQEWCQARDKEYRSGLESLRQQYMSGPEGSFDLWALHLNIRQWVLELRDLLGKCPPYPEPEIGGCAALFSTKTVAEVIEELEDMEENDKKKKPAKEKEKKKKDGGKEKGKGKKEKEEVFLWEMPRSAVVPGLVGALGEYAAYWNLKLEEDNVEQRMDLQLAKEKVRSVAEEKIRQLVDAMMVHELDRLRAVDREPPPRADKKKEKKDKGKGKRGKKDPLEGKSVEELYAELVLAGIVRQPHPINLDDYVGASNLGDADRVICRVPTPADLKMAMREMFGIPLSSDTIHSNIELRNSVMLAGPHGVGKTVLVNGLCRETGANLLDLSPAKLVGKYQGKKQDYLMNLLLKVGKAMEPTIFLVDECHLLFPTKKSRKRPDVDRDKPARWAKMLTRLMKRLKQGDRMLLVGVTNEPFFAKTQPMCKLFQNVFLVPFPEYGTRLALWKHFLGNLNMALPHAVNPSVMAKMTEGYTGRDIKRALEITCPPARQASKSRLRNAELIPVLAERYPNDEAPTRDDWITWYLTTPIMKAREALLQAIAEEEEAEATAKAGKKK